MRTCYMDTMYVIIPAIRAMVGQLAKNKTLPHACLTKEPGKNKTEQDSNTILRGVCLTYVR